MKTIQRRRGNAGTILETTTNDEKQHSFEVSLTAKGELTYSIKLYFESGDDILVVDRAKAIRDRFLKLFRTEAQK